MVNKALVKTKAVNDTVGVVHLKIALEVAVGASEISRQHIGPYIVSI
jgi:hypothetical protein